MLGIYLDSFQFGVLCMLACAISVAGLFGTLFNVSDSLRIIRENKNFGWEREWKAKILTFSEGVLFLWAYLAINFDYTVGSAQQWNNMIFEIPPTVMGSSLVFGLSTLLILVAAEHLTVQLYAMKKGSIYDSSIAPTLLPY